jgi:hypothetical protein
MHMYNITNAGPNIYIYIYIYEYLENLSIQNFTPDLKNGARQHGLVIDVTERSVT